MQNHGALIPLKTHLELAVGERLVDVWVAGVEIKKANNTLKLINAHLDDSTNFQHLRRFAKFEEVPEKVKNAYQKAFEIQLHDNSSDSCSSSFKASGSLNSDAPPEPTGQMTTISSCHSSSPVDLKKLLIVSSVHAVSYETLLDMLSLQEKTYSPIIISVSVPLLAPTSAAQAQHWSNSYWPTVYKKSNPYGPHHSIVSRAQKELETETNHWMKLAWKLAKESDANGNNLRRGEKIGAVIVERENSLGRVVAAAGDARWLGWAGEKFAKGNPAAHAVMRAISIVATAVRQREEDNKRSFLGPHPGSDAQFAISYDEYDISTASKHATRLGSKTQTQKSSYEDDQSLCSEKISTNLESLSIFHDKPLSITESQYFNPLANDSGYLCHGLEIYVTHEPCVMCSMAIIHSRFGRVVFEKRMHRSGGLTADGLLGYGLFWRQELNWTLLAWQWQNYNCGTDVSDDLDLEA